MKGVTAARAGLLAEPSQLTRSSENVLANMLAKTTLIEKQG
jgi:hypothetical protein